MGDALNVIRVEDPDDPRLRAYVALKDADLRARQGQRGWSDPEGGVGGRLMAEGEQVVVRLFESRFKAESVLVAASKLERMREVLGRAPAGIPIYAADQRVMDRIVGYHIHRGVLACAARGRGLSAEEVLGGGRVEGRARTIVVLEALANHDNIGGIFRNAAALGADGVLLSPECADPLYRKAIRVSMGHVLGVPFAPVRPWPAVLGGLRESGWQVVGLTPGPGSVEIREFQRRDRVALVVGTEGPGLTPAALASCEARVRIAMRPGVDSLNASVATGIALHRLALGTGSPGV